MPAQGILQSRYTIKEILGKGGMGVVYRAYDSVIKREVALKTIRDIPDPAALETFTKECGVLASMAHPNIIEIFDVGEFEEEGTQKPYFVMPLLPGAPLDALIRQASHRLTLARAIEIISQSCRGLQAAHERGLIHRDLKPSNIFVMEDDSVKIIDFGVAHMVDASTTRNLKGTLAYMAPEQLEMKPLSPQSDIFSLGVVAYEILTLRRPFQGHTQAEMVEAILHQTPPPASDFNPAINLNLSRALHKALAKNPLHRYGSIKEFADIIQKAFRHEPIEFFDPVRIQPRIQRAAKAFEQADYQFASEILNELEAEGLFDPAISTLQRQVSQVLRQKTIRQLLESARTRIEEEEITLGLQKIQEILQLDPNNADALGLQHSVESRRTEEKVESWLRLARQHLENYAYSHARDALQNLLQVRPQETQALHLLTEVNRREQEYLKLRKKKQELYDEALRVWQNGDVSGALSKLQQVVEIDRRAPDIAIPEGDTLYQNFYNQVRSQHDALNQAYAEARRLLSERNYTVASALCDEQLSRYPGNSLFQALKLDIGEKQRQELSGQIVDMNRRIELEPDLDRRVNILQDAVARFPGETAFESALRHVKEKRDLVDSIVAKARFHEEQGQFNEALGQWEILRTIHDSYPGLSFEFERSERRRDQQVRAAARARWVEQIDLSLESGDFDRAGNMWDQARQEFPQDPELDELEKTIRQGAERASHAMQLMEEGQRLSGEGHGSDGLEKLWQAHKQDEPNLMIRGVLVGALVEQARLLLESDWREAAPLLRQALDLEPRHTQALSLQSMVNDSQREELVESCVARARQAQRTGDLMLALASVEEGLTHYPQEFRLVQLHSTLSKSAPELLPHIAAGSFPIPSPANHPAAGQTIPNDAVTLETPQSQAATPWMEAATLISPPPGAVADSSSPRMVESAHPPQGLQSASASADAVPVISRPSERSIAPSTLKPPAERNSPLSNSSLAPSSSPHKLQTAMEAQTRAKTTARPMMKFLLPLVAIVLLLGFAGIYWMIRSRTQGTATISASIPLTVKTLPAGARILIDNQERGLSDLKLDVPAGSHQVTAILPGFETASRQLNVQPGQAQIALDFQLVPVPNPASQITLNPQPPASADLVAVPAASPSTPAALARAGIRGKTAVISAAPQPIVPVTPESPVRILTGGMVIHRSPAESQIVLHNEASGENRRISEDRLDLPEGNYQLTATAPGYNPLSLPVSILPGRTQEVNVSLQPTVNPNHQGLAAWEKPQEWRAEGNFYVHQGGNYVLTKISPGFGTYTLTVWRKNKKLQWLVNFRDENNYDLFALDKKNFFRTSVRGGKKEQTLKAAHNLEEKDTLTLQVVVTAEGVLHQVREGDKWVALDEWKHNRDAAAGGRFGFYLPGKDQAGFSQFSFKPQ